MLNSACNVGCRGSAPATSGGASFNLIISCDRFYSLNMHLIHNHGGCGQSWLHHLDRLRAFLIQRLVVHGRSSLLVRLNIMWQYYVTWHLISLGFIRLYIHAVFVANVFVDFCNFWHRKQVRCNRYIYAQILSNKSLKLTKTTLTFTTP